ncbi:MAG: sensor domain-containing diguanylate cyclase [Ilumatobacteraceae bacterium]
MSLTGLRHRAVTGRRVADRRLAESEARFRALANNSVDVVWHFVTDPYPHLDYVSPSVESSLGYSPSWFVADFDRFLVLLDDDGRRLITAALAGEPIPTRFDFTFRHADGSTVVSETVTSEVPGGLQGVSRDVTELRRLQATLAAQALRDPLTGLANRRLFDELFAAHLARTQRNASELAVAYLDLDELKQVNDTRGHDAGDIVLRETARRLREVLRTADIIARLGGDEFVVVFEHDATNPSVLVERIDEALGAPVEIAAGVFVSCPPSIGVASTETVGYDPAMLLAHADAAMYAMKRSRRGLRDGGRARPIT